MKTVFTMLFLVFCASAACFGSPKHTNKPHAAKTSAVQALKTRTKNSQSAALKMQVHLYTVSVRRTLDDCKRDDLNDQSFDTQKAEVLQDHGEYHFKAMDDMIAKKKAIGKDIADDLSKTIDACKVMHDNPLFSKSYLETERCFPDNFVPQGFQAQQLSKLRFVELK